MWACSGSFTVSLILDFVAGGCKSQGAGPRGSIAAKTGVNITKLEELNPQVKPTTRQPGDRARLRPELKVGTNCGLMPSSPADAPPGASKREPATRGVSPGR